MKYPMSLVMKLSSETWDYVYLEQQKINFSQTPAGKRREAMHHFRQSHEESYWCTE